MVALKFTFPPTGWVIRRTDISNYKVATNDRVASPLKMLEIFYLDLILLLPSFLLNGTSIKREKTLKTLCL